MSSVMHPSGPEPQNTYWIRRVVVVIAALVALMLLWWVLSSLFGGGGSAGTVSATPQNNPSLALDPALSDSPTPSASASATPSGAATPSASATPSAGSSSVAGASTTPSAAATSTSAQATPTPSQTPTPTGPVPCQSSALQVTITGDRTPQAGKSTAFTVTATNTGQTSCFTTLDASNTSLVITSGSDRIWTTADCAKWAPTGTQVILAGKSYTWRPTWQGKRSTSSCGLSSSTLGAGTYVATATLAGQSARLVMSLQA